MNLYFRLLWTLIRASFESRIRFGEEIALRLRVWPNDLDINGHMNNGRYMTIVDLAIVEYFLRSGFLRIALARGWRPMLGGGVVSFRRALKPLQSYVLRFSVVGWDDRWSYWRFRFERSGQTIASGFTKGAMVGRDGIVRSEDAYLNLGMDSASPAFPPALQAWIAADHLIRA